MGESSARPETSNESPVPAGGAASGPPVDLAVEPSVLTGGLRATAYAGHPVSVVSGNFLAVEVDLGFGPTLADLQVRRSYNSLDVADGPFGPGWSSWASCRLAVDETGAWADWRGPDGQVARILLAEGTCPGFEGRVSVTGSGMVAAFPTEAMVWRFDLDGRVVETSRGPGAGVRFEWDGPHLVSVTHARGRRVELGWEGDRIVSASADDGRRVVHGYDADGRLVSVDGPMGARRYEVDEAGLILSVTDADGVAVVANTYDHQRRVVTQRTGSGRSVRFHYGTGLVTTVDDDAGGPVHRYEHDRRGRLLRAVDGHGRAVTRSYDGRGRVVAVGDRTGAVTRYEWDDHDRQVAVTGPDGVRIETVHDDEHRPVTVTRGPAVTRFTYAGSERTPVEIIDPTGAVTRFEVIDGLIRRVTDPDGVAVTIGYDDEGRVVTVTDAVGGVRRYEWDATGQLAAVVSPGGGRTVLVRDPAGRLVEQVTPGGAVWRLERSPAGRITATVDPLGNRRTFELDDHGRTVAATDPLGATTRTAHDRFGNVAGRSLPGGGTWTFAHDALARTVAVTDPSGATWRREHDAEGNLTGSVTPTGVRRARLLDGAGRTVELHDGITSARFDHDDLGRPIAQVRPDGTTTSGTYDLAGRLVSITEPTGGTTRFNHSPAGRLIAVTGPEGGTARYSYDEAGRLFAATDAVGGVRRFRYDPDGRIVRLTRPTGETVRHRYDADGRVTSVAAPDGGVHRRTYDPAGRLLTDTDPTGATVTYRYDPAGRLASVTDPNGGTTRLQRDHQGRALARTDPLGAVTRVRLDGMGRVLQHTDPLGRRTEMTYDPSGRLVRQVDPDGRRWRRTFDASDRIKTWGVDGGLEVTVVRDLLGRIVRLADNDGSTVERAWDRAGSLLAESTTTAALGTVTMTWRYDRAGRRTAWTTDGRETSVTLDAAGRTREILDPDTGPITIARDPNGRLSSAAAAGWTEVRRWHDGRLAARTARNASGTAITTFERDAAGRITTRSTTAPSGVTASEQAAYDGAGQLVQVLDATGERTFTYDAGGRLTDERGPDGVATHTYDQAGQRIRSTAPTGDVDYTWDAAGRRLAETGSRRTRRYRYDSFGRTSAIVTTTVDGADAVRRLTHDPFDRLAAVDDTGLIWDPVNPFAVLRRVGDHHLAGIDTPLAVVGADRRVSWLDTDHRGTPVPTDPWGAAHPGPGRPLPGGLGLGLGGDLAIDDQLWLRARLYDPASRSFTTPDPLPGVLGRPSAANPYHFAAGDPLNRHDPSGLRPVTDADLDAIRSTVHGGSWDRYGGAVVGGVPITGGGALVTVDEGGPLAAALVGGCFATCISAAARHRAAGAVDWAAVGADIVSGIGAVSGRSAFERLGPIGEQVVLGTAREVAGRLAARTVAGDNPLDPEALGTRLLVHGVTDGAGHHLGTPDDGLELVERAIAP